MNLRNSPQTFDYLLMLRGICAVAVVLRHYPFSFAQVPGLAGLEWLWRPFGYVPVLLFFCLSGFLITQGFARRRYDVGSLTDLYCYYVNRILRVVPLYYLSILFCLYLFWPSAQARLDEVAALFWFAGAYKVEGEVVFNHVYWSLPIGVAFFALAPLVYLLCNTCYRYLGLFGSLCLVILGYGWLSVELFGGLPQGISVVLSRAEWNRLAHLDVLYNFEVFLLGAIAAIHLERKGRSRPSRWAPLFKLGLILSLLLLLERTGTLGERLFRAGRVDVVTLYFLLPLVGLWFLGFVRVYAGPRVRAVSRMGVALRRGLEALGHWAYALYLLHMPVLALVGFTGWFATQDKLLGPAALLAALLLSALVYRCIERPTLSLRIWPAGRSPQLPSPGEGAGSRSPRPV